MSQNQIMYKIFPLLLRKNLCTGYFLVNKDWIIKKQYGRTGYEKPITIHCYCKRICAQVVLLQLKIEFQQNQLMTVHGWAYENKLNQVI